MPLPPSNGAPDDPRAARTRLWLVVAHLAAAVAVAVQHVTGKPSNNFAIFVASARHLRDGLDLYRAWPAEHADLFKYSPTVALAFTPIAALPAWAGLLAWHLLNAGVLVYAICRVVPTRAAAWTLAIVLLEALGALQNAQSNGLCAGLMLLAADAATRDRPLLGALAVAGGAHIKLFPAAAGLFGAVVRRRVVHVAAMAGMLVGLAVLPLVVTSPAQLHAQYASWLTLLRTDAAAFGMWWVGGIVERLSGVAVPHAPIQLVGTLWVMVTAWRQRAAFTPHGDLATRMAVVGSLLVYTVLFNHRAEPPTFVIAFAGIGVWWSTQPRTRWRHATVLLVLIVGSLGGTDLVPRALRVAYHQETRLKAIVVLVAWLAMQRDVWRRQATSAAASSA
ncbi:MAG: DUF2029 domain-containing protein [Gemmatimonadaceae bacterium]|nr:DUF2029 domain-containing protein [Gemmatimonadaceae bacterium]